jgi:hypothetical protein
MVGREQQEKNEMWRIGTKIKIGQIDLSGILSTALTNRLKEMAISTQVVTNPTTEEKKENMKILKQHQNCTQKNYHGNEP